MIDENKLAEEIRDLINSDAFKGYSPAAVPYEVYDRIMEMPKAGGWISVKDKLPERPEHDWVLAIAKFIPEGMFGVPHVAEYIHGKWQFRGFDATDAEELLNVEVTHWMPLPEPWKG